MRLRSGAATARPAHGKITLLPGGATRPARSPTDDVAPTLKLVKTVVSNDKAVPLRRPPTSSGNDRPGRAPAAWSRLRPGRCPTLLKGTEAALAGRRRRVQRQGQPPGRRLHRDLRERQGQRSPSATMSRRPAPSPTTTSPRHPHRQEGRRSSTTERPARQEGHRPQLQRHRAELQQRCSPSPDGPTLSRARTRSRVGAGPYSHEPTSRSLAAQAAATVNWQQASPRPRCRRQDLHDHQLLSLELTLVKSATPKFYNKKGDEIAYTITATNTGAATLTNVDISDTPVR